jgi:serine/threonine-protein kinase
MFAPGDKLEYGHYTVLRELGAGGMGVVYHCRDEFLQREIAIKMLLPELMADDDTVEVFRQEARLAAQLEHPNVVTIHNIGIENKEGKVHHYIAMEFLPGGSLKQRIEQDQNLYLEQCLEWMKQLTVGLNYAHKRGVVHQDIKPDNIFITHDGNLKIGDFGLALIATGVAVERAVQGKGTPAYMSPELCRGDPQDQRSDIYSLGAVFFELLTREKPYKASGMIEMAMKHATAPVPSAKKINADVPDVLDKALQKMMAKNPDERYQSLSELLTIIEKLLLEMQVARLGVGTGPALTSQPKAKAEATPPPPIPDADKHADDFANFVAEKSADRAEVTTKPSDAQKKPAAVGEGAKGASAKKSESSLFDGPDETLDDLLDSLLSEQTPTKLQTAGQKNSSTKLGASSAADAAVNKKWEADHEATQPPQAVPESLEATIPPVPLSSLEATIPPTPLPTAENGGVSAGSGSAGKPQFLEDVTGEIDKVFQSVVRAEAAAMAQATHAARDAAEVGMTVHGPAADADAKARISRSGIPALSKQKQLDVIWRYKTQGPVGWCSSPTLTKDRKTIIVCSVDGLVHALDAAKGNVLWRYDTGAAILASPAVTADKLFVASTNGQVHALTPSGSKLWEYAGASPVVATPVVHEQLLLLASMDGTLKALDTNDAKVKWTYRTDGAIVAPPQAYEKFVFVGSKDKCLHAIASDKGWRQWVYHTNGPIVSKPLVSTDSVYIGSMDGHMYAIEAESGKLIWKYGTDQPIVCGGTLEFTSVTLPGEDKWVHCVEKYKGGLVWKGKLHSPVLSNLQSSAGNLYVANREGWVQCFTLKEGELKWQMNCDKRLESSPTIAGKIMYLAQVNGEVCAYALP